MLQIRQMCPGDYDRKGFVHWKSWQETYAGLMPEKFLTNQTLEKCQSIARRWPENTLVAELYGTLVGYGCYIPGQEGGEISAIYILKEAQGRGIGRKLMDALLTRLSGNGPVILWVLQGNHRAIGFYRHYGFRFDGVEKATPLGTELRMVLCRTPSLPPRDGGAAYAVPDEGGPAL